MIVKTKSVYYCGFCKRHGLSRRSMELHESVCTLNPERRCRWRIDGHSDGTRVIDAAALASEIRSRAVSYPLSSDPESPESTYLEKDDIYWLHDEVEGCPACMLAALRQSGVGEFHHAHTGELIFDYQQAVDAIRERERDEALADVW